MKCLLGTGYLSRDLELRAEGRQERNTEMAGAVRSPGTGTSFSSFCIFCHFWTVPDPGQTSLSN